jgi:hypothetical protein
MPRIVFITIAAHFLVLGSNCLPTANRIAEIQNVRPIGQNGKETVAFTSHSAEKVSLTMTADNATIKIDSENEEKRCSGHEGDEKKQERCSNHEGDEKGVKRCHDHEGGEKGVKRCSDHKDVEKGVKRRSNNEGDEDGMKRCHACKEHSELRQIFHKTEPHPEERRHVGLESRNSFLSRADQTKPWIQSTEAPTNATGPPKQIAINEQEKTQSGDPNVPLGPSSLRGLLEKVYKFQEPPEQPWMQGSWEAVKKIQKEVYGNARRDNYKERRGLNMAGFEERTNGALDERNLTETIIDKVLDHPQALDKVLDKLLSNEKIVNEILGSDIGNKNDGFSSDLRENTVVEGDKFLEKKYETLEKKVKLAVGTGYCNIPTNPDGTVIFEEDGTVLMKCDYTPAQNKSP